MATMKDNTRLKILLKKNHMKQREFADWFCISNHAAWEVIDGRRPLRDYEIVEICKRFNVSADWLLGLSDVMDCYFSSAKEENRLMPKDEVLDELVKAFNLETAYDEMREE